MTAMFNPTTVRGVLTAATRQRNSLSGNPQWKLTVNGYTFKTGSDVQFTYDLNLEELVNSQVELILNEKSKVRDLIQINLLGVDSEIHSVRDLNSLPVGSKVTGNRCDRYSTWIKRSHWQWDSGPVSMNPSLLLSRLTNLRVTEMGGGS